MWLSQICTQFAAAGRLAGFPFVKHVYTSIGNGGSHNARIQVELLPGEDRNIHYTEILKEWREEVGVIPEAIKVRFASRMMGHSGQALAIQIQGNDFVSMNSVKDRLKTEVAVYPFVSDIYDDFTLGKVEARLQLKDLARHLGVSLRDIAGQVENRTLETKQFEFKEGKTTLGFMFATPAQIDGSKFFERPVYTNSSRRTNSVFSTCRNCLCARLQCNQP